MKTKNNVQKAVLSTVVILTSIAVLNGSTRAQGFWSNVADRSDNSLAMKTSDNSGLKSKNNYETGLGTNAANYMEFMVVEEEAPLTVENWMLDDFIKENGIQATENKNELTSEELKPAGNTSAVKKQKKVYYSKTFVYQELDDPELRFEGWMFDRNHWKVN